MIENHGVAVVQVFDFEGLATDGPRVFLHHHRFQRRTLLVSEGERELELPGSSGEGPGM